MYVQCRNYSQYSLKETIFKLPIVQIFKLKPFHQLEDRYCDWIFASVIFKHLNASEMLVKQKKKLTIQNL